MHGLQVYWEGEVIVEDTGCYGYVYKTTEETMIGGTVDQQGVMVGGRVVQPDSFVLHLRSVEHTVWGLPEFIWGADGALLAVFGLADEECCIEVYLETFRNVVVGAGMPEVF